MSELGNEEIIMQGVAKRVIGDNIIIEINEFSEELKKCIRDKIIEICYGEYYYLYGYNLDYVNRYLREVLANKTKDHKIGFSGELIQHIAVRECTEFRVISPILNAEVANFRHGFDMILQDKEKQLWFLESKAGEAKPRQTANKKIKERIWAAKNDLNRRMNDKEIQLWHNSLTTVASILEYPDEKQAVVNMLLQYEKNRTTKDKNVIFGCTAFCVFETRITDKQIQDIYDKLLELDLFQNVRIIAVQKEDYESIIEFLENVGEQNEK